MCVGRGLDSQVPSTSTLNITTNLLNHLTAASGTTDQPLSGPTRQGARRGGTGSKRPGHLQPRTPSLQRYYPPPPPSARRKRDGTPALPGPPG